jgi:hypothetical protein
VAAYGCSYLPLLLLQIEGGFVQGMGWLCLEEMIWGDKAHPWVKPGHLFTKGPGTFGLLCACIIFRHLIALIAPVNMCTLHVQVRTLHYGLLQSIRRAWVTREPTHLNA